MKRWDWWMLWFIVIGRLISMTAPFFRSGPGPFCDIAQDAGIAYLAMRAIMAHDRGGYVP